MESSVQRTGNMSNMQEYTNQIVVYANENRWYESESLQKMLQSGAVQSRSGRGKCVELKDKSRKEMYTDNLSWPVLRNRLWPFVIIQE